MTKDFNAFTHGTGDIELTHKVHFMRPMEIHLKENGTKTNSPSFAIIMCDFINTPVLGEISLEMLNDGLADIGYKMVKL